MSRNLEDGGEQALVLRLERVLPGLELVQLLLVVVRAHLREQAHVPWSHTLMEKSALGLDDEMTTNPPFQIASKHHREKKQHSNVKRSTEFKVSSFNSKSFSPASRPRLLQTNGYTPLVAPVPLNGATWEGGFSAVSTKQFEPYKII